MVLLRGLVNVLYQETTLATKNEEDHETSKIWHHRVDHFVEMKCFIKLTMLKTSQLTKQLRATTIVLCAETYKGVFPWRPLAID